MIFLSLITLLGALAWHPIKSQITSILFGRITSISLVYSALLAINMLYFQSIGSGLGIYSGLFYINTVTQNIDIFMFILASLILIPVYSPSAPRNHSFLHLGEGKVEARVKDSIKGKITQSKEHSKIGTDESSISWKSEYPLIVLFSILGASCLISSSDLISMYLSIELQSFSVYILSTMNRSSLTSTNAGLKYFLLGGLSSCVILLGTGLIYMSTAVTQFEGIFTLLSVSQFLPLGGNIQSFTLGLVLIVIGFLFKIGAAPFYHWAPDVYDGVPTIVTTWLTIMPKISILIFLFELQMNQSLFTLYSENFLPESSIYSISLEAGEGTIWKQDVLQNLLLLSSLLSLIIGAVLGLVQNRIKRLLAYSTIGHVGFLLLALSINTEQSVESFIFYIIQYSLTTLNLFLIILAFGYYLVPLSVSTMGGQSSTPSIAREIKEKFDIEWLYELKGQLQLNPILSFSAAICLFSMAGIPPLIGFFGKFSVLYSAIQSGYYFMSFVAILVSVISAYYYLKLINIIHFSESEKFEGAESILWEEKRQIRNSHSFVIALLTLFIFLFWTNPFWLSNSLRIIVLTLFFV